MEQLVGVIRKLEYKGSFQRKEIIALLRDSLEGFGYKIEERDVAGNKSELKFKWFTTKNFDDYTKSEINIEATIKSEGDNSSVTIEFKGFLFTDYKNRWEKNPFFKIIKEVYDSTVYKPTLNRFKERLNEEMHAVVDDLKGFLDMYRMK